MTRLFIGCCVLGCCVALLAATAAAHELRPAYLRIAALGEDGREIAAEAPESEAGAPRYDVFWKQPLGLTHLTPRFPDGCEAAPAGVASRTPGALPCEGCPPRAPPLRALAGRYTLTCEAGLRGGVVAVEGLAGTITDVLLQVTLADGTRISRLLTAASPSAVVGGSGGAPVLAHLRLGVEHLLFGYDHILFVVALMFFLPSRPGRARVAKLVKTVTAFTVAHSVTLGVSALGWLQMPQAPVEAVIALSILFLAVEKLRGAQGTLTANHTWVVAFAFGLLHGFGFAGALANIGLPRENVLAALFLFNVGVELGQLAVVAAGLALVWLLTVARVPLPKHLVQAPLYAIGALSAYWFVVRTAAIVGWA